MTADRGRKNIIGKLRVRCTHMSKASSVTSKSVIDGAEAPRKKPRIVSAAGNCGAAGGYNAAGGAGGAASGAGALKGGRAGEEEVATHCTWEGKLDDMSYHLSHKCGFVEVDCVFKNHGCKHTCSRRDMGAHHADAGNLHAEMTAQRLEALSSENTQLEKKHKVLDEKIDALTLKVNRVIKEHKRVTSELQSCKNKLQKQVRRSCLANPQLVSSDDDEEEDSKEEDEDEEDEDEEQEDEDEDAESDEEESAALQIQAALARSGKFPHFLRVACFCNTSAYMPAERVCLFCIVLFCCCCCIGSI